MRLLFCIPTMALSGGVKVVLELAGRVAALGHVAEIFSYAGPPRWHAPPVPMIAAKDLEAVALDDYDFVLACNAFLVPALLACPSRARPVFFCQDYESFHHATAPTFAAHMSDKAAFTKVYRLPVPIIATSRAITELIRERVGRAAVPLPISIDKQLFTPAPRAPRRARRRVLLVGNYLMPYKGMRDGVEALRRLPAEISAQVVLVTQERRGREMFADLPFPVEIHTSPRPADMPAIYASCDLYCCASWYEGFGLPALEAFACGLPVVSTFTHGVSDYGVHGTNLLLARPNDPSDLAAKIAAVLDDAALAERLRGGGLSTAAAWPDWEASARLFLAALSAIERSDARSDRVDRAYLEDLLEGLEAEGCLTPIAVYREFERLATELDDICASAAQNGPAPQAATGERLRALRDAFAARLANERTQYYEAFRAKYDLCRLLLALIGSARFQEYVAALQRRGRDSGPAASASFSEIRYPDA